MVLSGKMALLGSKAEIADSELDILSNALAELEADTKLVLSAGMVLGRSEGVVLNGHLIVLGDSNLISIAKTQVALRPGVLLRC